MDLKLCESDFRFMKIIWENEPIASGELVKRCNKQLGWKKSTTYTVLKKLSEKGFAKNENSIITSIIKRDDAEHYASNRFIDNSFSGSLPGFLVAFLGGKKISNKEAEELKNIIDTYKE